MHQGQVNSYGQNHPARGQLDREVIRSSELSQPRGRLSGVGLAACKKVRFHPPYLRLARRLEFERVWGQMMPGETSGVDNFALFDAVVKRGGYESVCERRRWQQININLSYEKNYFVFVKHYSHVLLPLEKTLRARLPWYRGEFMEQTYQVHLLPANNLTPYYYHLNPSQHAFAQANYSSLDEYYNIKTVVSQRVEYEKVAVEYADKVMMARKWLLFSHPLQLSGPQQSVLLGAFDPPKITVLIMGIGLPSLVVANKLSDFGISVVIVDKTRNEQRTKDEFQILSNGLMVLEGGREAGSYYDTLRSNMCKVEELGGTMQFLDDEGKPFSDEKVRLSEEHFAGILEELKGENMNRRNLYEQMTGRVLKKKLEHERFLIKWHHDRYMLVNRLKGDQTAVAELASYESKKFVKHVAQKHTLACLRSCQPLYQRLKAKKNVKFSMGVIESIAHNNGHWDIKMVKESLRGTHLIYADEEGACRGLLEGSSRYAQFSHELLGEEGASALGQLTAIRYLNCYFRFQNPIQLRDSSQTGSFSLHCQFGFIYCFVLKGGHQILTTIKCYHSSNINYYQQVLKALELRGITRGNRLESEEVNWVEYTFGLKDEKLIESIIRLRQQQKMFLMLPITTTNSAHRNAANLDLANYIASTILHETYPQSGKCDPMQLEMFEPNNKRLLEPSAGGSKKAAQQQSEADKTKLDVIVASQSSPANVPVMSKVPSAQGMTPVLQKTPSQGLPPPAPISRTPSQQAPVMSRTISQGSVQPVPPLPPPPPPLIDKKPSQTIPQSQPPPPPPPPPHNPIVNPMINPMHAAPPLQKTKSTQSIVEPSQALPILRQQSSAASPPALPMLRQESSIAPPPAPQRRQSESPFDNIQAPISKKFPPSAQQQQLKVRLLTSVPEETSQKAADKSEGDIPTIEELHRASPDWFGLQHHYVRSHELYLARLIQKRQSIVDALANFEALEIEVPFKLNRGLTLCSLGRPWVKGSDWVRNALDGVESEGGVWLLEGMVTRREYFSLWDTFRTTVYYQTLLIRQEEVYYCIVDEQHPATVFYHTNKQTLIARFNARLEQARKEQLSELTLRKSYSNVRVTRNQPLPNPPPQLLPAKLNQVIADETQGKAEKVDSILEGKLKQQFHESHGKKFMGGQMPDHEQKLGIIPLIKGNQAQIVLSEAEAFLSSACSLHQLKPFSLFQVFFGILSEQHVACQISRKFTLQPLSYMDVTRKDEALGKQIQQVFIKSILNEMYSVIIIPSEKQVLTTRNFLDCGQHGSFEGYSYLMEMKGEERKEHWLLCQGLKERFEVKESMMLRIVERLLAYHRGEAIISAFTSLISREVNSQKGMSPRIALYFHMTRKQNVYRPTNAKTLAERCKKVEPQQRERVRQLMESGQVRWVENEFVYAVKSN